MRRFVVVVRLTENRLGGGGVGLRSNYHSKASDCHSDFRLLEVLSVGVCAHFKSTSLKTGIWYTLFLSVLLTFKETIFHNPKY